MGYLEVGFWVCIEGEGGVEKDKQKREKSIKKFILAGYQWLIPVILVTWEAEFYRITVEASPQA
jgi:hypothetical protein